MLTFNSLLRDEEINPAQVKLVRHQDKRIPGSPTPHHLWLANDGEFDRYQRIQRKPRFKDAVMLAAFVATPLDETLFVGLYVVKGIGIASSQPDPISRKDIAGYYFYDLEISPRLSEYSGRLTVLWGSGYLSWVQLAWKQEREIVEIRRTASEPTFPGFLDFKVDLDSLALVPSSWRIALSAVGGIYLLTDVGNGKQYVGSAQGVGGFWGRWEQYVASGHGGNRRMQGLPAASYQVSILEVASSSTSEYLLAERETRWKQKLLSRKFGLNANSLRPQHTKQNGPPKRSIFALPESYFPATALPCLNN